MPPDVSDTHAGSPFPDRVRSVLSELEEADFVLIDPPAELWERIEAAVDQGQVESPKEPPSRLGTLAKTVVEYWIDADDVVVEVGQGWVEFARGNDAPDLAAQPADRTLWSFFADGEICDLWRLLVERVRASQKRAEVPLRCDAPDARRWFDLAITPEPDGRLRFQCLLVFEEARPAVSILDPHSERDDRMQAVALCSWCGQAQHDGRWLEIEELLGVTRLLEAEAMPPISYGICGSCRDDMTAELFALRSAGQPSA